MGRELLAEEPVFQAEIAAIDQALRKISSVSILDELTAPEARSRFDDVTVVQPLLFAMQAALVALLRSWGLEPDLFVGHSMGELVAAYVSGALDLADAVTLIHHHSRLYGRTAGWRGWPSSVCRRPAPRALEQPRRAALRRGLHQPCRHGGLGELAALDELLLEAKSRGISGSRVDITIGAHSHVLDPLLGEMLHALRGLTPRKARIPLLSTVTLAHLEGPELDAAYWVRNMREPVFFYQAMDILFAEGYDTFIEIGPTPILTRAMQQSIDLRGARAVALGTARRGDERAALLETAGALYTLGAPVRWERLSSSRSQEISPSARLSHLLPLSGKSPEALLAQVRAFSALPAERPDLPLSDLCYAASVRRSHHEHRLSIVADSMDGLHDQLRAFAAGESGPGRSSGRALRVGARSSS